MKSDRKKLYPITFQLNGQLVSAEVRPNQTLLQFLRESMQQWDVKDGCSNGYCGTCTILLNGVPRQACLILVVQVDGADILTARGMGDTDNLHPLQEAFISFGAIQCGFCTPGMLVTAKALLDQNTKLTRDEVREAISGNLCRCTGYQKIVDAISSLSDITN